MLGFAVVVVVVVRNEALPILAPGSHSIYITIGPEFLGHLTLSLPHRRGSCVRTRRMLLAGRCG